MRKEQAESLFGQCVERARTLYRRSRRAWFDIAQVAKQAIAYAGEAGADEAEARRRFADEVGMSDDRLRGWLRVEAFYGSKARPDHASLALHEELMRGRSPEVAIAELRERIKSGRARIDDLRGDEGRSPTSIIRPKTAEEKLAAARELAADLPAAHRAELAKEALADEQAAEMAAGDLETRAAWVKAEGKARQSERGRARTSKTRRLHELADTAAAVSELYTARQHAARALDLITGVEVDETDGELLADAAGRVAAVLDVVLATIRGEATVTDAELAELLGGA